MSGLAGVVQLDGAPAGKEPLAGMLKRLVHRGAAAAWSAGPAALGVLTLATTPEEERERQPLSLGPRTIAFHGRLDNLDELRAALGAPAAGDAELALRAVERWGDDAPARLLGDFAFACWDAAARRLLAARDPRGLRPFAYAVHRGRLAFASEPGALFADPALPREPNETMVAEHLADAIRSREETLWKGVLRLPPSHVLVAEGGRVRLRAFVPKAEALPRLRSDAAWAEAFGDIFRRAVAVRLRSPRPVAADLSGGIDSSAVVAVSCDLRATALEAFSEVFPGLPCDESPYIKEVVAKTGVTAHLVPGGAADPAVYRDTAAATLDFPGYPNSAVAMPARRAAAAAGFRTVLTGTGGDEWFSGPRPRAHGLVRPLLRAVLPGAAYEGLAAALGRRRPPAWIAPAFARRIGLARRLRAPDPVPPPVPGRTAARRFARAFTPWEQHLLETDERDAARLGLELRHPFLDARVAAVALACPARLLRRGSVTKPVVRAALLGLLPERVRTRADKADVSHLFADTLRALGGPAAFADLALARHGWADPAAARALLQGVLDDEAAGALDRSRRLWPAWMTIGLEIWARSSVII